MRSGVGGKKTTPTLKRFLPALAVPFLVGICELNVGLAPTSYVVIAAVVGVAVSVLVPNGWPKAAASLIAVGLILSTSYVHELEASQRRLTAQAGTDIGRVQDLALHSGTLRGAKHGGMGRSVQHGDASLVHLETLSVVLPCAFEGAFAEQTVDAIVANTNSSRLREIIVVDDGSRPPLSTIWPKKYANSVNPVIRILRHERTEGLISAKKSGGDAATSDVIVFFDCHISPRRGWEEAFITQMKRAGDHRTVVVPTITSLDPDTWLEIPNGPSSSACFTLLNADFTWLSASGRDVPLMSGGLLAISRRWWQETGGYDEHMVAWGGENIDQSIRTWLCGGRIEAASGAYVAHMWRDSKKPKTMLRYPIPTADVMRNKARAVTAWFDEWRDKVFTFPEYEAFVSGEMSIGDMSNFDSLKSRLTCAPFSSYINRFAYVYLDGGLIPQEVFQLREESTGLCLERVPKESAPHDTVLVPCAGQDEHRGPGSISELQLWHGANRDRSQTGMPCCSGLMNWNFFTCMDAQGIGARVRTYECAINGASQNQAFQLDGEGRILYRNGEKRPHLLTGGCVAPEAPVVGVAVFSQDARHACKVEAGADVDGDEGVGDNQRFRFKLRSESGKAGNYSACAVAAQASDSNGNAGPGWKMNFQKCDEKNSQELLHAKPQHGGYQVSVSSRDSGNCLDSAGGGSVLIYPCYADKDHNMNQVWHIVNGRLVWHPPDQSSRSMAVDFQVAASASPKEDKVVHLRTCSGKEGQRIRKHDVRQGDSFVLRDEDTKECVGSGTFSKQTLRMVTCDKAHRFKEGGRHSFRVPDLDQCLDADDYEHPQMRHCSGSHTQRFEADEKSGWVKVIHSWEDNGRRRYYERCLDSKPEHPIVVSIQPCDSTVQQGVRWTRINSREPIETTLWNKAAKPSPDAVVLGGDAEPPTEV